MVQIAASPILYFLEKSEAFAVQRYEITLASFNILRRSLRRIILTLKESNEDEALEIAGRFKLLLSEWLTVPVSFNQSLVDALKAVFREPNGVRSRWGGDISESLETAVCAAESLCLSENPMREKLRDIVSELRSQGKSFKIYCHKRARVEFESILQSLDESTLDDATFLNSVRDYRQTEPFDVLIKVGPLRARGWGSAPDAVRTAPRFCTLVLMTWSGCRDEPGFGYDPASSFSDSLIKKPLGGSGGVGRRLAWTEQVEKVGDDLDPTDDSNFTDELQMFKEERNNVERRHATLIQLDVDRGILYPPFSQVLSFDPSTEDRNSIALRIPSETLLEGMFLIRYDLDDLDLGGLQAKSGYYSQIWRDRLEEEWHRDELDLEKRLQAAGLDLIHLPGAIKNWCKSPDTVIHAPQKMKHFEILIRVLGLANEPVQRQSVGPKVPWWRYAWNEVRRSRGEAIQAGVLEQEILEEELMKSIMSLLPIIKTLAGSNIEFTITLPSNSGMQGLLSFSRICGIEGGFTVADSQLRIVHDLSVIDQWRD